MVECNKNKSDRIDVYIYFPESQWNFCLYLGKIDIGMSGESSGDGIVYLSVYITNKHNNIQNRVSYIGNKNTNMWMLWSR